MKFSGIDLHSNDAVVAVIDDQGRVLYCSVGQRSPAAYEAKSTAKEPICLSEIT